MRVLVAIVFYLVYWLCCFLGMGTDKKNLLGLRSYPDAVQRAVRAHPVLGLALKNFLGLYDFGTAFWFFFALGEGLVGLPRLLSPAVEKSDQALLTIALGAWWR